MAAVGKKARSFNDAPWEKQAPLRTMIEKMTLRVGVGLPLELGVTESVVQMVFSASKLVERFWLQQGSM